MASRNMADYYNTTCHVLDPDNVIVQGMRFIKDRTCRMNTPRGCTDKTEMSECQECGVLNYGMWDVFAEEEIRVKYCPNCGARVVE